MSQRESPFLFQIAILMWICHILLLLFHMLFINDCFLYYVQLSALSHLPFLLRDLLSCIRLRIIRYIRLDFIQRCLLLHPTISWSLYIDDFTFVAHTFGFDMVRLRNFLVA